MVFHSSFVLRTTPQVKSFCMPLALAVSIQSLFPLKALSFLLNLHLVLQENTGIAGWATVEPTLLWFYRKNPLVLDVCTAFHDNCTTCRLTKSHMLSFDLVEHRAHFYLELIHYDVWQSSILSHTGFEYYISFIEDCSCFTWIYPMTRKSEVYTTFKTFKTVVENLFNCKIKMF